MRLIHKEIPLVLCVAASVLISACGGGPPSTVVSSDGFGAIRFGMTVAEAEKALGVKLVQGGEDDALCMYFQPERRFDGLAFMTSNGVIVRLDVSQGDIATDTGAKIGDSEQSVLQKYQGRVQVQPHKYTGPQGHYLVVTGSDGKAQLVFETDGTKVVNYRAGREPQVQYVEGCS